MSHRHPSLLRGLGTGQLSQSDEMASQPQLHTRGKSGAGHSGGREGGKEIKPLSEQAGLMLSGISAGERGGCGCVMYRLSRC